MTRLSNIDIIKNLWSELPNNGTKTKVIEDLAEQFGLKPNTIARHWVTRFWSIPVEREEKTIDCLRKWVKKTEKTISA